jgi:hypothetical protein
MRRVAIALAVCTLSLSTALPAAAEDLTIVSKSSSGSTTFTEYISSSVGAQDDRIYDLVNGKVTVISRDKKEYWEGTTKELDAQGEALRGHIKAAGEMMIGWEDSLRSAMEDTLARRKGIFARVLAELDQLLLTPAQRKAKQAELNAEHERLVALFEKEKVDSEKRKAEARILYMTEPSVSVQKGAGRKEIAGYDCEQYVITTEDAGISSREEWWVAPDLRVPAYFEMLKIAQAGLPERGRIRDEMKDKGLPLGRTFTSIVRNPEAARQHALAEHRELIPKDLPPGPTVTDKGVESSVSWEVVEVKKGPIDPSVFQVPAGYNKVESPTAKWARTKAEQK